MRYAYILVCLLCAASAQGQMRFDAGGGDSFGGIGAGASITAYGHQNTLSVSGSYVQDRSVVGVLDQFKYDGLNVGLGSQSVGYQMDGGYGVSLACVCASVTKTTEDSRVQAFAGLTGAGYFLYGSAALPSHFGTGVLVIHRFHETRIPSPVDRFWAWRRSLQPLTLSGLGVLSGGQKTASAGATYRLTHFVASGSVGLLNNQKYAVGTAMATWSGLTGSVSHSAYWTSSSGVASGDSAGLYYLYRGLSVGGGINESYGLGVVHGRYGSAGATFRLISNQWSYYHSRQEGREPQSIIVDSTTVRPTNHLLITTNVSHSNNGTSISAGGGYTSRRLSFSLTRQVQFLLNGRGYQIVTAATLSFRIGDTVINGGTVTDPFGKTTWSAGTESYVQKSLPFMTPSGGIGGVSVANHGKFVVSGECVDENKEAVGGCAIVFDKTVIFSNDHGKFEFRTNKRKAVNVAVSTNDFTATGDYELIHAPKTASAGDTITVVVRKKIETASKQ